MLHTHLVQNASQFYKEITQKRETEKKAAPKGKQMKSIQEEGWTGCRQSEMSARNQIELSRLLLFGQGCGFPFGLPNKTLCHSMLQYIFSDFHGYGSEWGAMTGAGHRMTFVAAL